MIVILVFIGGPPYGVLRILIHYNELVFRRTPGVDTSHDIHCAKLADLSLFKTFQFWLCLLFK